MEEETINEMAVSAACAGPEKSDEDRRAEREGKCSPNVPAGAILQSRE